ncbi:MAG: Ig-like domain-containing protein [Brevefilum sp.]
MIAIDPLPNTVIDLNQSISLHFNQPMDKNSVEAAIHFQPGISGRFSWEDEKTVTFTPEQSLSAGGNINLTLDTSAQAMNELNLPEPFEVEFSTAEPLRILQVFPEDDTQDVDPQSVVFVAFNQPVVPLGAESEGPPAFTLIPEVPGKGEWLNTHTYMFTPQPTMDGGAGYSIQINEALAGVSGALMDEEQEFEFRFITKNPRVLSINPREDELLSLNGPIRVEFNVAMNPESVEAHFDLLAPGGTPLNGSFEWGEDHKTLTFTPSVTLGRDRTYTIQLHAGAESSGGVPIENDVRTNRTTYPAFTVDPQSAPKFYAHYGQYGSYQINFSCPIQPDNFKDAVQISPDVNTRSVHLSEDNTTINLSGYFLPETQYTVLVDGTMQDVWGNNLREDLSYTFSTPAAEPNMSLVTGPSSNNLVFVPAVSSEVVLQATNINTVTVEVSPITIDDLVTLLHPDNYDYRQVFLPESLETTVQNLDLPRNINEIIRLPLSYEGEPLAPGVYFLRIGSPDINEEFAQKYQKYFLIVSENNLVMKIGPEHALVWAAKLDDRSSLVDRPLTLFNTEGEKLARGVTNEEGMFEGRIDRSGVVNTNYFTVMGEPGSSDFGFSISTWGQSYGLFESGIRVDTSPGLNEAYIYTDRPIYRPGDMIHFKAVVFNRENGLPVVSGLDSVDVTLTSDAGLAGIPGHVYSETLALDRFNTVADSIQLSEDAPTGFYNLKVEKDEKLLGILYFNVKTYRKPEIEIGLEFGPDNALAGKTLEANLQADYFFGLPAADQSFSWSLYRADAGFNLPGYRVGPAGTGWLAHSLPPYSPLGMRVDSGEGQTDPQGQSDLTFATADLDLDALPEGGTHEVNLEISLQDEGGVPVSFRDSVMVHPESFYIGVQPETIFGRVNSEFNFSILTVGWEKEPVGDVPINAIFETIRWEVEETMNPERPYRYMPETDLVASASPVTDAEGKARISFTPETPGTYQLTLESGEAVTQTILWVAGESSAIWPRQAQNQIQLIPDAETYQPGQFAKVFIPNPFKEGGRALVTVERGEIMRSQILNLSGSGQTFSLRIDEAAIPNIYFSVVILGEDDAGRPDYRQGVINLPVAPITKTLDVSLTLDPGETQPGENVSATLSVRDAQGNPVQGEFSVAAVDKALLSIVDSISPPIVDAVYGEQPLSIQTSTSLKTYANQLALTNLDLGRGGGGSEEVLSTIREDFPDTAFWEAEIITGTDGTSRLSIPMPDSLTTWVVTVRGLTEDFLVGETEAEVVTQKKLMIRPVTPRFLVHGDRVELAAVVHNNTDEILDVDVSLQSIGFTLDEEGLQNQRVKLSPGSQSRVLWWGTVESLEEVDLTFIAASGNLNDASKPVWGTLPVLRYVTPLAFSTFNQLTEEGEQLEIISLPPEAEPDAGSLSLELQPSLASMLIDGIEALESEGYQDSLSILSRLLANLNAYLALRELGMASSTLEEDLVVQIEKDIKTLLDSQHIEGGWAWWQESQNPDPFTTAYVLLGLEGASQAGLDVGVHFIDQAASYLYNQLISPGEIASSRELDRLVFQVYALRNQEIDLSETLDGLYARRSELSPWSVGLLALTIHDLRPADNRMTVLINDLENNALRTATSVHWEGVQDSWILPGSSLFNTSVALYTLAQLDPASTSLTPALHYLLAHQEMDGGWSSRFDTAWVLMAIVETLQGTGSAQADFDFNTQLNDLEIAEGSAASALPVGSVTAEVPVEALYPDSPNALQIQRSAGTGTLYYRIDLQTFQHAADAEAINRGIRLQRDYYPGGSDCPGSEGCEPIQAFRLDPSDPSQMVQVALTVTVPHDMYHFMLEEFIPSGSEVLDAGLKTSALGGGMAELQYDPHAPFTGGWGWWWFDGPRIYDDHLLWTADYLPAGTYTLVYKLLPLQRGTYQVLPAHAWQYFFPEVMGTSAGSVFEIE